MPAIIVETIAKNYQTPYELGNTKNILTQDVLLHIFTENAVQRDKIIDILLKQKDKQTYLLNINNIIKDNKFKLKYDGQLNPDGLNYGDLINNVQYRKNSFFVETSTLTELNKIGSILFNGIVRWSIKIFP